MPKIRKGSYSDGMSCSESVEYLDNPPIYGTNYIYPVLFASPLHIDIHSQQQNKRRRKKTKKGNSEHQDARNQLSLSVLPFLPFDLFLFFLVPSTSPIMLLAPSFSPSLLFSLPLSLLLFFIFFL